MQLRQATLNGLCMAIVFAAAVMQAPTVHAAEMKTYTNEKYGFELQVPKEFQVVSEDRTVSLQYQPGAAAPVAAEPAEPAAEDGGKKKKSGIGGKLKQLGKDLAKTQAPSVAAPAEAGGGLQPALQVYINWTWMPDVASGTLYQANKDGIKQDIASPDPKYKDVVDFDKKKGYAHDGNTFWYKEIDKKDGSEIHRWHIYSAGNKSAYTIGLTGTYEQFKEWGPVFEEVVKSFKLIPIKK